MERGARGVGSTPPESRVLSTRQQFPNVNEYNGAMNFDKQNLIAKLVKLRYRSGEGASSALFLEFYIEILTYGPNQIEIKHDFCPIWV